MDIASLVGGLGIGSVFTLFLKEYFDKKKVLSQRIFEEKKTAYANYLHIAAHSQTMSEKEALWARTAAQQRIHLCGSQEVIDLLEYIANHPDKTPRDILNRLAQAMRKDLFPQVK